LFHDFIDWIQYSLGKSGEDGLSWSEQLVGSSFMWNVLEGTHVLTLMFFAGTIWIIDLRMMGIAFRHVPFSTLNDRVLPITMIAFAAMVVTGAVVFIGRDPLLYYHDVWFRFKMIFLVLATINIAWFHFKVQKSQDQWNAEPAGNAIAPRSKTIVPLSVLIGSLLVIVGSFFVGGKVLAEGWLFARFALALVALLSLFWFIQVRNPNPPFKVKLSGFLSMLSWFLIIIFGRFIAYDWYRCEKVPEGSFVYVFAECKQALSYMDDEIVVEDGDTIDSGTPADGAAPADGDPPPDAPADPPADGAAPAAPAPAQPAAPGQGG
jgi:hypothetical protein